jgi:polysaccharide biosynthesis transport protein
MISQGSGQTPGVTGAVEQGSDGHVTASDSLFEVIWRHAWIVLGCMVLALVAGFVYLAKATPIFTSESRLYVEQSGPRIMGDMERGVMTGSKNYLYTQMELMKATEILSEALKKCNGRHMQTFADVDNYLVALKGSVRTSVGSKDDIISVSFDSPYPEEAADIVNSIVDAYITWHDRQKKTSAGEVMEILQAQRVIRSQELSNSMRAVVDFKEKNEALALETNTGNIILSRLERLSLALTDAELAALQAQAHFESAQAFVDDPTQMMRFVEAQQADRYYVGPDTEKVALKQRLELLRQSHADRLCKLTAEHPAVRALTEQINRVEKQIRDLDEQYASAQLAALEQRYLTAQKAYTTNKKNFDEQLEMAQQLGKQVSEYELLQYAVEQSRRDLDLMDDRIKELNVTEDAGVLNISLLEVAERADRPSSPRKARTMAMAMVLGLMLGGGVALLRDMLDHRIRTADEVSALLGVALLGTVPSMRKREKANVRGQKVHVDSQSTIAEAFRTIRTSIFFSVPQDQARVIQVTSPMPGEGKSTLASNIAIAIAQSGQKVLLIDADFRRPTQYKIFDVSREMGTSGVLSGIQALDDSMLQTDIENLWLLPSGPEVPNPAELLGNQAFKDLLTKLKPRFDRILIDSPPVVPVADSSILAAVCDVTLLVVRAEESTRKALQQAKTNLAGVGARLIGAVVNDVKHARGRYGYYGYGYGYGDNIKESENLSRIAPENVNREAITS